MTDITNYNVYVDRMKNTAFDKCWWVSLIHDDIDTIVDVGCGDGEIFKLIDSIFPDKFFYVGVDCDEHMVQLAKENLKKHTHCAIYNSLNEVVGIGLNSDKTVVVMNSVLHEIYTYMSQLDRAKMFRLLVGEGGINPKYIAIRDMHIPKCVAESDKATDDIIKNSAFSEQYSDYLNNAPRLNNVWYFERNPLEFLLKYLYKENWEKERDEFYFWDWKRTFYSPIKHLYTLEMESDFTIPYLVNSVARDFGGLCFYAPTHKKMLLRRKD